MPLALLTLVGALAVLVAPAERPEARFSWAGLDGPAAIPLTGPPATLTATIGCAAVRDAVPGATLLATVPPRRDPAATRLAGLELTAAPGPAVMVRSGGADLGTAVVPAGDCTFHLLSDRSGTRLLRDAEPVLSRTGDVRPAVAGAFTDLGPVAGAPQLDVVAAAGADPVLGPLGAAALTVAVLALLALLAALARCDRSALPPVRLVARRGRPRAADMVVVALLVASTAGRTVAVWPGAPAAWDGPWAVAAAMLPGLVGWLLFSRAVVPRLGRLARRRGVGWAAVVAFAAWWVPSGGGSAAWVAVASVVVLVAAERAVARRAVLPLALALLVAGSTTVVAPGGLAAYAPVAAAALPLLRLVRARRDLHRWPLVGGLTAVAAAPLVLVPLPGAPMAAGADVAWGPVLLLTAVAGAGVLWTVSGRGRFGIAAGPARRLLLACALAAAAACAGPATFGVVAGLAPGVLVLGLAGWSAAALRVRTRGRPLPATLVGTATLTAVGGAVLATRGEPWSVRAPAAPGALATAWPWAAVAWAVVGTALVAVPAARAAWRGSAVGSGRDAVRRAARTPVPRGVPAPAAVALALAVTLPATQLLGAVPDGGRGVADAASRLLGAPCPAGRDLLVEADPAAGALPAVGAFFPTLPIVAADVGGRTLPGIAITGTGSSPWLALDDDQRGGRLPVVVTTTGAMRPGDRLVAEFAPTPGGPPLASEQLRAPGGAAPVDSRLPVPSGATAVRLLVDAPAAVGAVATATASLPRAPRLAPLTSLVPPGTVAIADHRTAAALCLTPAADRAGVTGVPHWRVGPPAAGADPGLDRFAAARQLVVEERMALYDRDDPMRDPGQLYHWEPVQPLETPSATVTRRAVWTWVPDGLQ